MSDENVLRYNPPPKQVEFDPRDTAHRTSFRTTVLAMANPKASKTLLALLDYIDELETQAKRDEEEIGKLEDNLADERTG